MGQMMDEKLNKLDKDIVKSGRAVKWLKYHGPDEIISSHDKVKELAQKKTPKFMAKTGMLGVDVILEGFRLGTVNIISGPSGEGKTTWAQTLTTSLEVPSVWFSFEVREEEFMEKFNGSVPLFYLPKELREGDNTIKWLKDRVEEAQAKFKVKAVFIDHLHYLQDMQGLAGQQNSSLYIGDLMRKLKSFSIEAGLVIFLIVHIAKEGHEVSLKNRWYSMKDIRDSSFVFQEADTVMMIWRRITKSEVGDREYTRHDNAFLNIDKHRRTGKVGLVKLDHVDGKFLEHIG